MNHCAPDWNAEDDLRYSHELFSKSNEKKSMPGPDNELLELLHRNGHVSVQSQANHEPLPQPNQVQRSDLKPINLMHEDETASWFRYDLDDTFGKELCPQVLYEMPNLVTIGANKPNKEVIRDSNAFTMPPPKPQINDIQLASSLRNGEHVNFSHLLRHNLSNASKCVLGIGEKEGAPAISPQGVQENTYDTIATSSSGQPSTSNQNLRRKRKNGDEFECHSEEAEYESTEGNELNQLPASTRKSRAAEVHNLSERRRRDRINEKMRALQELIPHCNKTDKASMLDEAIEYLKSLQLQLQVMWMGNGMATMMFPSVQQYMDRASILPMNKPIQLSRTPPLNQMNPINFPAQNMESYDQYYGFPQTQLAPQAMNLCSYGSHMLQQNQTVKVSGSNSLPTSGIHFENGHSGLKHGNSTW